jgi:hypothetical protein
MILLRGPFVTPLMQVDLNERPSTGRFDLVDCLHDYRSALTLHGDDVLAHSNWEIGEKWLRQYG